MMEASVVIPTYNRKVSLRRAVRSVLAQEGVPFELIVVDDGSTDGTSEMLAREFPSAAVITQPNRGPAAARNRGIEASGGEWIAFLDSDDEWTAHKLKAQMDFFRAHPDSRISQTEEIWIRNGRRVNPMKKHRKYGGWIFEKCLPRCIVSPSAVIMHRGLFDAVGPFDESLPACEDYDLWLRVSAKFPIGLIPEPHVIKHGGHADQRSREFPAMDRFRIRALVKILESGILSENQAAAARKELERKIQIVARGAEKRGKWEEAARLRNAVIPGTDRAVMRG